MSNVKKLYQFDPKRDIAPVEQTGFINLREAYKNGCVPGDLNCNPEDYNGVDDPSSLIGKSADVFESIRKASYVKSAEKAAKASAEAASSAENE